MNSIVKPGEKLVHRDGEVFHLFPGQQDGMDSVIPIRWCICPDELKKLKEKGARNLHMLIIVKAEKGSSEERFVVPFNKEMVYITLRRPGKHHISATIIWCEEDYLDGMKKWLNAQHRRGYYENNILSDCHNEEGTSSFRKPEDIFHYYNEKCNNRCSKDGCKNIGEEVLELEVATEFFAKDPPKWLKTWGNLWYETKPIDQCHFRKRCIVAFTVQPPIMSLVGIFTMIVRLVISTWFLLLGKGINLIPIVRPFKYTNYEIYRNAKPSIFAKAFTWMLSPMLWIVLLAIAIATRIIMAENLEPLGLSTFWASFIETPFKQFLLYGIVYSVLAAVAIFTIQVAAVLFAGAIAWIATGIGALSKKIYESKRIRKSFRTIGEGFSKAWTVVGSYIPKAWIAKKMTALWKKVGSFEKTKKKAKVLDQWVDKSITKWQEQRVIKKKTVKKSAFEKEYEEYEEISCPGVAREASIAALPKKRRTVSLRFHALKRRVCKPFAQ